jgi:flagellar biosynthesis GTPase FlhF
MMRSTSFLSSKSPAELAALLEQLSPPMRQRLLAYLQQRHYADATTTTATSEVDDPEGAAATSHACAAAAADVPSADPASLIEELTLDDEPMPHSPPPPPHGASPRRRGAPLHALSEKPLLSAAEIKSLLPAVAPGGARRFLREMESGSKGVAAQQKALKELASFSLRAEQARAEAVAERSKLTRLAQQQSQALIASAARMATMRQSYEEQQNALERETEKSRRLERGLRAMARSQQTAQPLVMKQQQQQQQPRVAKQRKEPVQHERRRQRHAESGVNGAPDNSSIQPVCAE